MSEKLPLFPLNALLVPQVSMELQIFEQRYLRLIKDCIHDNSEFGIVPIRDGKEVGQPAMIYQLGVSAEITEWNQSPDGLLLIKVTGRRKFRVLQTEIESDQLMQAQVEYLPAETKTVVPDQYAELQGLYQQLRAHPDIAPLNLPAATDARHLGWFLMFLLPIPRPQQIALLAMHDPVLRLQNLSDLL